MLSSVERTADSSYSRRREDVNPMRAVVYDRYGAPDVLRLDDVERPVPEDDEVLVKIQRHDRKPD
jgi:hypothetical protein